MATTGSPRGGGSDELFAEPAEALHLITHGAAVGATAAPDSACHAASALPATTAGAPTPFDAAVQAALLALAEHDATASTVSATSASTHAAAAEAAVTSVVTDDTHSAKTLTRLSDQVSQIMYPGDAATLPPVASTPSADGASPPKAGGISSPAAGSMTRPSFASTAPAPRRHRRRSPSLSPTSQPTRRSPPRPRQRNSPIPDMPKPLSRRNPPTPHGRDQARHRHPAPRPRPAPPRPVTGRSRCLARDPAVSS
jgi:hypothetical protein